MSSEHSLVWFRGKDLRLCDHAPLCSALEHGEATLLFVLDPFFFAPDQARQLPHRIQYLLESLESLARNIAAKGGRLLIVEGRSIDVVPEIAQELAVSRVVAHRWTEPFARKRDEIIARRLAVPFDLFEGETLLPPESVRTGGGTPFAVFTPFARAARQLIDWAQHPPLRAPTKLPRSKASESILSTRLRSVPQLTELNLKRNAELLPGGERAARKRLKSFLHDRVNRYDEGRDLLGEQGTSRLSQDLKFGTLSVRTAWWEAQHCAVSEGRRRFLDELLWREFAYATLWDRPTVMERPFRSAFANFPYDGSEERYQAWQEGRTGVPVVDAAARQLLREGFVHNRARMISASFLTKNLLVSYRRGEEHYLRYLTDGDWAQNNMGWQWSAGCGVDAAPYFRVFNPVTQGRKFDPEGRYVRQYVPEISKLPSKFIHAPWEAPEGVLRDAGVELGQDYPSPIVDLAESRREFLARAQSYLKNPAPEE